MEHAFIIETNGKELSNLLSELEILLEKINNFELKVISTSSQPAGILSTDEMIKKSVLLKSGEFHFDKD